MVMVRLTKEGEGRDVIWRYLTSKSLDYLLNCLFLVYLS